MYLSHIRDSSQVVYAPIRTLFAPGSSISNGPYSHTDSTPRAPPTCARVLTDKLPGDARDDGCGQRLARVDGTPVAGR